MNYKLVKSSIKDIDRLVDYKKRIIYAYANKLSKKEIDEINKYAINEVNELINDYRNIIVDNKIVGCLLVTSNEEGLSLDEIYLEEEYRNKKIGTNIIKDILNHNNLVYLWVYKDNTRAITLYKKMGFIMIEETKTRYYMKYCK